MTYCIKKIDLGQENDIDEMRLAMCWLFFKLIDGFVRLYYTSHSKKRKKTRILDKCKYGLKVLMQGKSNRLRDSQLSGTYRNFKGHLDSQVSQLPHMCPGDLAANLRLEFGFY